MFELPRSLWRNRRLLKDFVVRDLRARYVGSSMGFFWSVIFPILNLAIYTFVFNVVLRARWDDKMPTEEVVLLMLAGILVWSAYAESLSRCTNSLVDNANLIQKVVFPSEVLSPYLAISSLVNMMIGVPLVLACVAWFGYIDPARPDDVAAAPAAQEAAADPGPAGAEEAAAPEARPPVALRPVAAGGGVVLVPVLVFVPEGAAAPENPAVRLTDHTPQEVAARFVGFGPGLLALPLLLLGQLLFTVGVAWFLSAFNLLVRDTYHVIGVLTTVWMFATPIFYPAELVAVRGLGWVLAINPMHWLISCYRDVLLYGAWPDWALLARFLAVAVAAFLLGAQFFRAQRDRFPDLL